MIQYLVLAISLCICVIDIRSHRIPNSLSLWLAVALLFDSVTVHPLDLLLAAIICVVIAYLGKIGAGDVKLFLVLVATSGSLIVTLEFFLGMALISLCVLVASFLCARFKGRENPRSIAFAPSILIPFLALYLAI